MSEKIPTLEELLNWTNSVGERKLNGEKIPKLEHDAAEAVFLYVLAEAYRKDPLQIYAMLTKHKEKMKK